MATSGDGKADSCDQPLVASSRSRSLASQIGDTVEIDLRSSTAPGPKAA